MKGHIQLQLKILVKLQRYLRITLIQSMLVTLFHIFETVKCM